MKSLALLFLLISVVYCDFTPLTADEVGIIRPVWAQVKNREVDILYKVFKDSPEIQARFPAFTGKDVEKLKGSVPFAIHATRIVSIFTKLLDLAGNSDHLEASKTIVRELGVSHRNRGISKDLFSKFRTSLTEYLENHVTWNEEIASTWNKGLDNIYDRLFAVLDG